MELKKLFTRKSEPQIIGENDSQSDIETEKVSKIYLELGDLEGKPTYELSEILTIGSEFGDIILDDESISGKHCTFSLNQDVISLMDHSSQEGTFLNKKALDPGRIYILQEKDKIKIGNLNVKIIHAVEEKIISSDVSEHQNDEEDSEVLIDGGTQEIETPPELHISEDQEPTGVTNILDEESLESSDIEDEPLEVQEESTDDELEFDSEGEDDLEQVDEKTRKILKASGSLKSKNKLVSKGKMPKGTVGSASSALTRVLAIIIECLIIFVSMSLFKGNIEFQNLLQVYPNKLLNLVQPYYQKFASGYIEILVKEAPFITPAYEDLVNFFSNNQDLLYGLILFAFIRVTSPLLFGVSLGQVLIGITGSGQFLLKRIFGVVREVLGLILGPFLLFDLSTLFSNRSFKEIVTFTHIETKSNTKTILLCLLWIPGIISFFLLSPLIFEEGSLYPIPVNEKVIAFKPIELAEVKKDQYSNQLEINFNLNDDYVAMPYFQLKRSKNKKVLLPWFNIINMKTNSSFTITKSMTFDLKKFLAMAIEGNYLSSWKYDKIHAYVNDIANSNKNFTNSVFKSPELYSQIQDLVSSSLNLNFDTLLDHLKTNGPFLNGYLDFRRNLSALVQLNEASVVEVKQIGDSPFLIIKNKKNNFAIQLNKSKSNLYKIGRLKKETFYNDLKSAVWSKNEEYIQPELLNFISFTDILLSDEKKSIQFFQKSYELFYDYGKKVFISDNEVLIDNLSFTLNNLINVIETIKSENKDKFVQNTTDLLKAVKDKDKSFFGISDIKSAALK